MSQEGQVQIIGYTLSIPVARELSEGTETVVPLEQPDSTFEEETENKSCLTYKETIVRLASSA